MFGFSLHVEFAVDDGFLSFCFWFPAGAECLVDADVVANVVSDQFSHGVISTDKQLLLLLMNILLLPFDLQGFFFFPLLNLLERLFLCTLLGELIHNIVLLEVSN